MARAKRLRALNPVVQDVLDRSTVMGNVLKLPEQLDRAVYVEVNKALTVIGGKWDRKAGGHVFPFDPAELIQKAVDDGAVVDRVKTLQFFETPEDLAERMVELAQLKATDHVLEPSAGHGRIVRAIAWNGLDNPVQHITAVEIDETNLGVLATLRSDLYAENDTLLRVLPGDFLELAVGEGLGGERFDAVVMNPPFAGGQDIDHIQAAYRLLKPGGRLVAICSEGPFFRTDAKSTGFRGWLEGVGARSSELHEDTFRKSGAGVRTRIVQAWKPK